VFYFQKNQKSKEMNTISQPYFRALLENYLNENHPKIADREELLENRSKRALQTYRELSGKGAAHETALEIACLELTDGLGFSMYQFLYQLICEDFAEIPDEKRRDFCFAIFPECQKISDSLSYDGMDEWEARFHFEEKMAEVIQCHLKILGKKPLLSFLDKFGNVF
jgi:hypothetical protein